jgi:hypothetical protein
MPARYSVILVALVVFHPWPHDCTPEHDEPHDNFSYVVRADQHGHRIPDPCRREPRVPLLPLVSSPCINSIWRLIGPFNSAEQRYT